MDLEEMKTGWKVLNEYLEQNEVLNQRIIKEMITTRTRSAYEKVYNFELRRLLLVLLVGLIILPGNMFLGGSMKWVSFFLGEMIMCFAVISQSFIINCLSKFNLKTGQMNELSHLILKYRRYSWNNRLYGTMLAFGFLILFIIMENTYTNIYVLATIIVFLIVGLAFSFIQLKKYNQQILSIEQGLAELREFEAG